MCLKCLVNKIVESDHVDPHQEMGDPDKEVSEEDMDKSNELKREAVECFGEGKTEECIAKYTEAIRLNPGSALLHAKLNDLNLTCFQIFTVEYSWAKSFCFSIHRLLGHWEQAAIDLRQACKIDFDEQADEWLKEVTPHVSTIDTVNVHPSQIAYYAGVNLHYITISHNMWHIWLCIFVNLW